MRKTWLLKDYIPTAFPLNLFIKEDSITVRLFARVQRQNSAEGIEEYEQLKSSALNPIVLTKDDKKYEGKHFLIEDVLYQVRNEMTIKVPSEMWKPNNEVCLATSGEGGRNGIAFYLRKRTLRNNHFATTQQYEKNPNFTSTLLFTWLVLPNSTLLTAPVMSEAPVGPRIITNLNLGTPLLISDGKPLTYQQRQKGREEGQKFRDYWLPSLKIEGPNTITAAGVAEFLLVCEHKNGMPCKDIHEYIVNAVSGYAPHTRVVVENGVGKFRMMALGLKKGDVMKIRVDDKNWIGKAEKTVMVN